MAEESAPGNAKQKPALPETPFDGVIVSRDVQQGNSGYSSYLSSIVSLLIVPEADLTSDDPRCLLYSFETRMEPNQRFNLDAHLRPGHKVRVKQVSAGNKVVVAHEISFNLNQFTKQFRPEAE